MKSIRDATARIDGAGRFQAEDRPALRDAVSAATSEAKLPDHPADLFGPWDDVPEGARRAFREVVAADARAAAALFPAGSVWTGAVRACWEADRHLATRRSVRGVRRRLVRSAARLHDGPLNAWRRMRTGWAGSRWDRASRPGVSGLMAALGRDARWLMGDFVEGVPLSRRQPGFLDDRRRNVIHGYHLGLDLLETRAGICCIEVNVRPGLGRPRILGRGQNPLPRVACDLARSLGVRRLIWVESQNRPIPDWAVDDLTWLAPRSGLQVEILEDPCMARRPTRRADLRALGTYRPLDLVPAHTLVLNRDQALAGPDQLLAHKETSIRALQGELRRDPTMGFFVLPMTRDPVLPPAQDPGFPNLVYKYPDTDSGEGVFFMRARDSGHAVEMARRLDRERGEPPGLFQPFVACTLASDRCVWDVRAEILLTPRGALWIRGLRRDATRGAPARVEPGVVRGTGIFASNISAGGRLSDLAADDEPRFREAALSVGEALRRALCRTFLTSPEPDARRRVPPRAAPRRA